MTKAYPLQWPKGWPRTKPADRQDGRKRFRRNSGQEWTLEGARNELMIELDRLGVEGAVISSNLGGLNARPDDQGIAVYFGLRGKPMVMAQDAYQRAEENMRSMTLAIEAMRQLERHGGGVMMEKAFTGFEALPAPKKPGQELVMTKDTAREVLGVGDRASDEDIRKRFRLCAKEAHADAGGSDARMRLITQARDVLLGDAA